MLLNDVSPNNERTNYRKTFIHRRHEQVKVPDKSGMISQANALYERRIIFHHQHESVNFHKLLL